METCVRCGRRHPPAGACPGAAETEALGATLPPGDPRTIKGHAAPLPAKTPDKTVMDRPGRQAPEELRAGLEIGGYVLESCLGRGGMGEVWKAVQPRIKKAVAIKVLDHRLAMDGGIVTRFLREAQ